MQLVYLDNNATTQPAPEVLAAMRQALEECWANPSSAHRFGQLARHAIDQARAAVAALIGSRESEVFFTSCGTESINTALRAIFTARAPRRRIVTSTVEHSATRGICQRLAQEGAEVVEVPVDSGGELDMDALARQVTADTALVSIMWVNNETGVIFPVNQIAQICRSAKVPFHCDATQAAGKVAICVTDAGIDALSLSAHKFHGPKGAGALYMRRGLHFQGLLAGGPQERGHRGGTENVPGIVGMGKAAELATAALDQMPRVAALRDSLEEQILKTIPHTQLNGRRDVRVANTANISFAQLEAEAILLLLSEQGIYASAGSACSSGSLEPSHVLAAMKIPPPIAHGAVRFSLSRYTTQAEIDRTLAVLPAAVARLRAVLPLAPGLTGSTTD